MLTRLAALIATVLRSAYTIPLLAKLLRWGCAHIGMRQVTLRVFIRHEEAFACSGFSRQECLALLDQHLTMRRTQVANPDVWAPIALGRDEYQLRYADDLIILSRDTTDGGRSVLREASSHAEAFNAFCAAITSASGELWSFAA